jgi:molecular chaperone DnaK
MAKVIGIDLGTTNSCVSVMEGGSPTVITNAEGFRTTPSVVAYTKSKDKLVGHIAKRQAVMNPDNTFGSIKRFIGRRSDEVNEETKNMPYSVDSEGSKVKIKSAWMDKSYSPEEISASVLRKLADDASKYLGQTVTQAVVTVPAYFNDSQRQATKDAGRIAGLEVLRIINEPTAAALAYGLDKKDAEKILVFDLGGGTFDVSILEVGDGVFEVISTCGDAHLGGDNFDTMLVNYMATTFEKEEGVDLRHDAQALQRLTEAAEKAKIELSSSTQSEVNLPFITATEDGPKHLTMTLTRGKFEELSSGLIDRCKKPVQQAIKDAKLSVSDLNEVVMVGGSSRIPAVLELVKIVTGLEPNQTVNPDEVVAIGAAVQGGVLSGEVKDILLLDVTPLSLGVETMGSVVNVMVPRNTTIPSTKTEIYSTAMDGQSSVEIHVLQGERQMASDNKSLGTFRLDGIPAAPRGLPQIEVAFDIDANGILSVAAKDKGSGKEQSITITGSSTLSENEVNRMLKDAETNADSDQQKREAIDTKNDSESIIYQAEKQLLELEDKVSPESKTKVELVLSELKETLKTDNTQHIKERLEGVKTALMEMGVSNYSQQVETSDYSQDAHESDDVIDAEIIESPK